MVRDSDRHIEISRRRTSAIGKSEEFHLPVAPNGARIPIRFVDRKQDLPLLPVEKPRILENLESPVIVARRDPARISLVHCLNEGERSTDGFERRKRLRGLPGQPLGLQWFLAMRKHPEFFPAELRSKERGFRKQLLFDGTLLEAPGIPGPFTLSLFLGDDGLQAGCYLLGYARNPWDLSAVIQ